MHPPPWLSASFFFAVCAIPFAHAEKALSEEQRASAVRTDAISIPTPGEVFAALNKQAKPNWPAMMRPASQLTGASRARIALHLGVLVADGFIAIEAQDGQQVKNLGRDIIGVSKSLGVSQDIISRGESIADFAQNNDWTALSEEIESTQNEVKMGMVRRKDGDLVALVTLGAWLRGLEAASEVVQQNPSPETAALLRQPGIVEYLSVQTESLPERMRSDPIVGQIVQGLAEIHESVNTPWDVPLNEEQVAKVHQCAAGLVAAITGQEPEKSAAENGEKATPNGEAQP